MDFYGGGSVRIIMPHIPKNLNFTNTYLEKLKKNHQYTLPNGCILQITEHSPFEVPDCCESKILFVVLKMPSVFDLNVIKDGFNNYLKDNNFFDFKHKNKEIKLTLKDLKNGIILEEDRAIPWVLKKIIAKKRWINLVNVCKIVTYYKRFLCRHCSFGRLGYLGAKEVYEML